MSHRLFAYVYVDDMIRDSELDAIVDVGITRIISCVCFLTRGHFCCVPSVTPLCRFCPCCFVSSRGGWSGVDLSWNVIFLVDVVIRLNTGFVNNETGMVIFLVVGVCWA